MPVAQEPQVMALQCVGIFTALRDPPPVHRVGARLASFRLGATTVHPTKSLRKLTDWAGLLAALK